MTGTSVRGYRGELVLEEHSRSTWQNIAFAIDHLVDTLAKHRRDPQT